MIIIRHIKAIIIYNKIFSKFDISLSPLHEDNCNGLAKIGIYIMKIAGFALLVLIWGAFFWVYPIFFGEDLNIKPDTIFMLSGYIIAAPLLLFLPAWSTHSAMVISKKIKINQAINNIQPLLDEENPKLILKRKKQFDIYYKRYLILEEKLHTWPFPKLALGSLMIIYVLPLIYAFLQMVIEQIFMR